MTKSRTLRKAGAVVLSLAMAASTLLIAPDSDAATKVKLSSTSKTFAAKGGSKSVTVKNVAKANVKSLTVSTSKKAVATVKKSSKVKFKVTAKKNTSTKAVKATITAKVVLKKLKYGKKTYSKKTWKLKFTAKVKAAATPTEEPTVTDAPAELALEKVEAETDVTSGVGGAKYLRVYFSQPLTSLDFSECEVRRVEDNQLFAVESVTLATDGKSARVAMVGDALSSGTTAFLDTLTPYKFIVRQNGKTAEKEFTIPETIKEAVVTNYDAEKKTVTLGADGDKDAVAAGTTFDIAGIIDGFDLEDLIGRTVSAKVSKAGVLESITPSSQTVVFGKFEGTAASAGKTDGKIKNGITGTEYSFAGANTDYARIKRDAGAYAVVADGNATTVFNNHTSQTDNVPYAKVVLNSKGAVSSVVYFTALAHGGVVSAINGTQITTSDGAQKLNDFTIVKDAKTASIADIQTDDFVYFDAANKAAIVYTNKLAGVITTSFIGKFTIGGTEVSYTAGGAKYLDAAGAAQNVDVDYTNGLKKEGKEAYAWVGLDGKVSFVRGAEAVVDTQTIDLVLSADATATVNTLDGAESQFKLTGLNAVTGKSETYIITAKTITNISGVASETGKTSSIGESGGVYTLTNNNAAATTLILVGTGKKTVTGALVTLTATKDATPTITGIKVTEPAAITAYSGADLAADHKTIDKSVTSVKTAGGVFTVTSATELYILENGKTYAGKLSNFAGNYVATAHGDAGITTVADGAKCKAIIIANGKGAVSGAGTTDGDPIYGIVTASEFSGSTDGDNTLTILKNDGTTQTFNKFGTYAQVYNAGAVQDAAKPGALVKIVPDKTVVTTCVTITELGAGASDYDSGIADNKFFNWNPADKKWSAGAAADTAYDAGTAVEAAEGITIFGLKDGVYSKIDSIDQVADGSKIVKQLLTTDGAKTVTYLVVRV